MYKIFWYRLTVGDEEVDKIRHVVRDGCVSMGRTTQELESRLAKSIDVPYCIVAPSGSVAILMALMALNIGQGDEVIVPNRGWISAAHAVLLIGAKPVLVDVCADAPLMDVTQVRKKITKKTKVIIPLHLNGLSADMDELMKIGQENDIPIVEDACQSLFSKSQGRFIGTRGIMGCFSMGMGKLVATGQGGFVVTKDPKINERLRMLRTHGVKDNFTHAWHALGFNFKFTDVQAAIGLVQLDRAPARLEHLKKVYRAYEKGLHGLPFIQLMPADLDAGEIPIYIETLVEDRKALAAYLERRSIQTRLATPDLDPTPYLESPGDFPHSRLFSSKGLVLPCGPDQPMENIDETIRAIQEFNNAR